MSPFLCLVWYALCPAPATHPLDIRQIMTAKALPIPPGFNKTKGFILADKEEYRQTVCGGTRGCMGQVVASNGQVKGSCLVEIAVGPYEWVVNNWTGKGEKQQLARSSSYSSLLLLFFFFFFKRSETYVSVYEGVCLHVSLYAFFWMCPPKRLLRLLLSDDHLRRAHCRHQSRSYPNNDNDQAHYH